MSLSRNNETYLNFISTFLTSNFTIVLKLLLEAYSGQRQLLNQLLEDYSDLHRRQHVSHTSLYCIVCLSIILRTAYFVFLLFLAAAGGLFGSNPAPAPGENLFCSIVLSIIVLLTFRFVFFLLHPLAAGGGLFGSTTPGESICRYNMYTL